MHKITVIGTSDSLENTAKDINSQILLRTDISDAAQILKRAGVKYTSLDYVYDKAQDFDELDTLLADEVIKSAGKNDVAYIVPGSAVTGDGSVKEIVQAYENVEIIAGQAPEYAMLCALSEADASCGYSVVPAACVNDGNINPRLPLIVTAIDNELLLGDTKILLSDEYGDEHIIFLGSGDKYKKLKLYECDREKDVNHNTMIYVPPKTAQSRYDSYELSKVFMKLRSPEGCPWDRKQDHVSLKRYLLEECAEVLDAIDGGDMAELMDELGDVLLQVLFHATIAQERGDFDMRDVTDNLVRKLIKRHPHVFADAVAQNPEQVLKQWDEIKHEEKEDKSHTAKLKSVPKSMTALMRAQKILSRAAKSGLMPGEENDIEAVWIKIEEQLDAINNNGIKEAAKEDIGFILLNFANIMRLMGDEGELVLQAAANEFISRFEAIEAKSL